MISVSSTNLPKKQSHLTGMNGKVVGFFFPSLVSSSPILTILDLRNTHYHLFIPAFLLLWRKAKLKRFSFLFLSLLQEECQCFPLILCANVILSHAFFVIMSNTPNILEHSVESSGTINTFVLKKQWSRLFFHIYLLHMPLHLRLSFFF